MIPFWFDLWHNCLFASSFRSCSWFFCSWSYLIYFLHFLLDYERLDTDNRRRKTSLLMLSLDPPCQSKHIAFDVILYSLTLHLSIHPFYLFHNNPQAKMDDGRQSFDFDDMWGESSKLPLCIGYKLCYSLYLPIIGHYTLGVFWGRNLPKICQRENWLSSGGGGGAFGEWALLRLWGSQVWGHVPGMKLEFHDVMSKCDVMVSWGQNITGIMPIVTPLCHEPMFQGLWSKETHPRYQPSIQFLQLSCGIYIHLYFDLYFGKYFYQYFGS